MSGEYSEPLDPSADSQYNDGPYGPDPGPANPDPSDTPGVFSGQTLLLRQLSALFPSAELKYKPQSVKGNRALLIWYVDARAVMDRLDDVMGVDGWQDSYEPLDDGNVICRLSVRVSADEWITKTDVGSPSEQPDAGDRGKAAFSDSFKRAAVKFGIGRYLYRMPMQWADYDPNARRFVGTPQVPAAFVPKGDTGRPSQSVGGVGGPVNGRPASHVRGDNKDGQQRPNIQGTPRLLPAEAAEIDRLLTEAQVDRRAFFAHYAIGQVKDLAASKYQEAINRLRQRILENKQGAGR